MMAALRGAAAPERTCGPRLPKGATQSLATVLVTGGSGFVGGHVVGELLSQGHHVRATVRSLSRESDVHAVLHDAGPDLATHVTCVTTDLTSDDGWAGAVAGCDYVVHVASPIPAAAPAHENDVIVPARDGTLRVLRAARDAGVRRVVMTSSCGAVYYGHPPHRRRSMRPAGRIPPAR